MPSFEKSPPELVARFDAAAPRFPDAQRRKMFGYPALFVAVLPPEVVADDGALDGWLGQAVAFGKILPAK